MKFTPRPVVNVRFCFHLLPVAQFSHKLGAARGKEKWKKQRGQQSQKIPEMATIRSDTLKHFLDTGPFSAQEEAISFFFVKCFPFIEQEPK